MRPGDWLRLSISLKVEDAKATSARAKALGAVTFDQAVGPGELENPAIRSVGGSVMHFIDDQSGLSDVWTVELTKSAQDIGDGTGLCVIDHVAETMIYDEMLSWSLFCTSIFDMHRTPMVDVVDPDGLLRSQAIKARDGTVRITLNGAEAHRTLAGTFLADSFGGAVQHFAIATVDNFATAGAMRKAGFDPLPMTGNYHNDLQARFGLDESHIGQIKEINILYDAAQRNAKALGQGGPGSGP